MAQVYVDVDLSDFEDDDIKREYERRSLGEAILENGDARELADLIVSRQTSEALDLLHKMTRGGFHLAMVKRLNGLAPHT